MRDSDDWSEAGVSADLDFHHAIARATGNTYYADFMAFMGGALQATIRTARSKSGHPAIKQITVDEHAAILEAIRRSDPVEAGHRMRMHLQGAKHRMLRRSDDLTI